MNLVNERGEPVVLGQPVGHGGEATVYHVTGKLGILAKIYNAEPRDNYLRKLTWMVDHPPENPTASLNHASLAWPCSLVYDTSRNLKGYCMAHIDQAAPVLDVFNPRRRAIVMPQFDQRYLHRTARNLAAALSALHRSGNVAGDINESNVLVTPAALVTLIDTDSFQVCEKRKGKDVVYACPVGKPEYTPPELQGLILGETIRLPDHDSFGLAVLIFQLLMNGSHPFRAQWLGQGDPLPIEKRIAAGAFPYAGSLTHKVAPPLNSPGLDTLHPKLAELFRRCFIEGHISPRWRPGPDLWARVIGEAEASLVCCSEGHFYSSQMTSCPYCTLAQKRASAVPVSKSTTGTRGENQPTRRVPRIVTATANQKPSVISNKTPPGNTSPIPNNIPPPGYTSSTSKQSVHLITGYIQSLITLLRNFKFPVWGWPRAAATAGTFPGLGSSPTIGLAGAFRGRHLNFQSPNFTAWVRQWITNSVTVGGTQGALVGMLPGILIALAGWLDGTTLNWRLLLATSGVVGGLLRGWLPGYRLATLINQYIGWKRFWQGTGILGGAVGGSILGFLNGWSVIPVILGLVLGAWVGMILGEKFWKISKNLGWERIWGGVSAVMAAGLGWIAAQLAGLAGLNAFGENLTAGLLPYGTSDSISSALLWLMAGGVSGALFGAFSGMIVDMVGRFTKLTR